LLGSFIQVNTLPKNLPVYSTARPHWCIFPQQNTHKAGGFIQVKTPLKTFPVHSTAGPDWCIFPENALKLVCFVRQNTLENLVHTTAGPLLVCFFREKHTVKPTIFLSSLSVYQGHDRSPPFSPLFQGS